MGVCNQKILSYAYIYSNLMEISLILVDIEDKRAGFIGDQTFFPFEVSDSGLFGLLRMR